MRKFFRGILAATGVILFFGVATIVSPFGINDVMGGFKKFSWVPQKQEKAFVQGSVSVTSDNTEIDSLLLTTVPEGCQLVIKYVSIIGDEPSPGNNESSNAVYLRLTTTQEGVTLDHVIGGLETHAPGFGTTRFLGKQVKLFADEGNVEATINRFEGGDATYNISFSGYCLNSRNGKY